MSSKQTDGEAIAASLSEPRAFGVVFERHFGAILRNLRRRLDDRHAEEATAQTFFVAFDARARFDPEQASARPCPDAGAAPDGSEAKLDAERMRGALAHCLAELPTEEADVYLLVWAVSERDYIAEATVNSTKETGG